jgi:signal peptidase I
MKTTFKVISWVVSILIGMVIILLGLIYYLPGYDLYTIKSDSMIPTFKAGDMIVTVPPGFMGHDVTFGSVVTFDRGGADRLVTHRVFSIDEQGNLTLKGDSNEQIDPAPVPISQVGGVYLFKIPYAGYVNAFVHTRVGWFLAIVLPGMLLVIWIIAEILREAFKKREAWE